MHKPELLRPGDKVALIATAGIVEKFYISNFIKLLNSWQLEVITGRHLYEKDHQFAGIDKNRLEDLQQAADDPEINAVFCARGGYGTIRIIESFSINQFKNKPKWFVGFSDVTVLHSLLHLLGFQSVHGAMAINLKNSEDSENQKWELLKSALFNGNLDYTWPMNKLNRTGSADGIIVGGNLSILYSLIGTAYDINTTGKMLLIEDVGEHLYHLDRIMQSMRLAGKLDKLEALLVGGFTEMKDDKQPFGKNHYEIILDAVKDYDYPVYFDFPAGHQENNLPVILGADYTIVHDSDKMHLKIHS